MAEATNRPKPGRGLSANLLLLTVIFVLLGEVLIYVPSIARFRLSYLDERLASARLATLSLQVPHEGQLSTDLKRQLLRHAGVRAVTLWEPRAEIMLGTVMPVDQVFDLRDPGPLQLVLDGFTTLFAGKGRVIRVIGRSPLEPAMTIDIILDEDPMRQAMLSYSRRILDLSLVLSVIVAGLLFLSLQRMIVLPLRDITAMLTAFRRRPEDASLDRPPSGRSDEIGVVERELRQMQEALRSALRQKTRLAALGAAVSQISHDLKNILASAVLISDRLEASADPAVRKVAPRLVDALDRAIRLCVDTLSFARDEPRPPRLTRFALAPLVEEVIDTVAADAPRLRCRSRLEPGLELVADRDQLYRVLLNVARNAREAIGDAPGEIRIEAARRGEDIEILVRDTGPGIPEAARGRLFETFSGSTKPGGSGLGLAICREIMHGHGGAIGLVDSGPEGTAFRLSLPARVGSPMATAE